MNFAIQVLRYGSWESFDWYAGKTNAKIALSQYQSNNPSKVYRLVKDYE